MLMEKRFQEEEKLKRYEHKNNNTSTFHSETILLMAMKDFHGNILQYLPIKDAEQKNLRFATAENRLKW